MPWYNGDFPPSYKNQPALLREKAVAIANALLKEGNEEGIAIATGLKRAREYFEDKKERTMKNKINDQKGTHKSVRSLNAGNSDTRRPGRSTGNSGKLSGTESDEEAKLQTDSIPGNQTDQPFTAESAPDHGTDPSKLSDL